MRIVVTRPEREARRWVEQLRARGHDAVALPLIAIGPAPDPQALRAARARLARYRAAMFVSANAVHGFLDEGLPWPGASTRAWAPGPGTCAALRACEVPEACLDAPADDAAQFDSEALWAKVQGQLAPGDRLLLVRGAGAHGQGEGREWLSQQLAAAGVAVDTVAAYARTLPDWTPGQRALAQAAAQEGACWLFSSSEAVANLQRLLPQQHWGAGRAIATHPRIAQAARDLGFGQVRASRPALADVVASIESAG